MSPKRRVVQRQIHSVARTSAQIQSTLQDWTDIGLDWVDDAKALTVRGIWRSQRWFTAKPPEVRTMLMGGSVAVIFAAGCGLQILSQQMGISSGGLWEAAMTNSPKPHVDQSGTINAALESVPIIRQTVQNPSDPAITLIFAGNAALGQSSTVAIYQQADLLMSNLDNSLAASSATALSSPTASSSSVELASSLALKTTTAKTDLIDPAILKPSVEAATETAVQERVGALTSAASYLSTGEVLPDASEPADPEAESMEPLRVARTTTLDELLGHGVDLVNLATDQMTVDGTLPETLNLLRQQSIYPVGAGQNRQEARRPQVFEVKGQKIAILGYSDSDLNPAGDQIAGLNPGMTSQLEADIKAIRSQVDWVIVSYHWSQVVRVSPEPSQITLAHAAIDQGADLVVGYAPQVMQGAEMYGGRAIAYSLGDDINEFNESDSTYSTAALKVTFLDRNMQVEFLPIQVQQHQSAIATGEASSKISEYLRQASSLFDRPLRSPQTLDARSRVSLPTAPNSEMPSTDPFVRYPSPLRP
ncbi:MAG: CapA family protein [Leptolyngbyaceae cyanobacterium CRU_2_3]|nr:CapA family protein [Leptolyngbyaceae cyanobacterium CRU_2_3]